MNSVERWLEQMTYDLDTAEAMLKTGRYLYVAFCSQQAIEKGLKAFIVKQTHEFPPRLHDLTRLSSFAGLILDAKQEKFLGKLSTYYIQTRYPEEIEKLGKSISKETADQILSQTKEIIQWLLSIMK